MTRAKIVNEIRTQTEGWENFYLGAGSPEPRSIHAVEL